MVDRIRNLIKRFPEDEGSIRELIKRDSKFDGLCEEYREITDQLHRLERVRDPGATAAVEGLKMRRNAVEEELLTKMEGYQPV